MTPLQQLIDEMKARCEKATPPTWWSDESPNKIVVRTLHDDGRPKRNIVCFANGGWAKKSAQRKDDALFVAHAREDLPRVLKVVEKLLEQRNECLSTIFKGFKPDTDEAKKYQDSELFSILGGEGK